MPLRRPDDRASPASHPSDTPTVKVGVRREDPTKRMKVRSDQDTERMPAYSEAQAPAEPREQPAPELSVHERLLNAARERFSTDGYENATTAAIARQAGTSESQLVKHFGSKEGLLESIFDEAWGRLESAARTAMEEHPAPLSRLLAVADSITRAVERDRKLRSLLLLEARRIRKNGYDVVLSTGFRHFIGLVDGLFSEMERHCLVRLNQLLFHLITGPKMKLPRRLVVFIDDAAIGSRELNRPTNNRAQHRLEIQSRAHCLANFSQCFQFPNRPREFLSPRLQFLEETHVLDCDYCLVGEGFKELDLRWGERAHLHATCVQ